MLDPKEVTIEDRNGKEHHYVVGRLPYGAGGREVCSQYISTALPKVGNYAENEKIAKIMLKHVAIILDDGKQLRLSTDELVNNHIPDFITGIKLEVEALEHNAGFSVAGKVQEYQQQWEQDIPAFIMKILTQLRDFSQQQDNAPLTNSEPSIQ